MKNKFITILFIVLIVISAVFFICFSSIKEQTVKTKSEDTTIEEERVTFEVNDIIANSGEEITIRVKLLEDSNFAAANFELLYDSSKMEYIKYENGEILEEAALSIVNNDENNDKILIAYVGNPQNKISLIENGDLISITFKIKKSISDVEITPEFKCTTLKEKDGKDIENVIKQGKIIVK